MADKKTIVVFGGTGGQGGSVVKTLLKDPNMMSEWSIRAVTRDVSKPAAKALAEQGVEMVTANMDDKASLKAALTGAYAVYLVTNYWETMNPDVERKQGTNVADVAKELNIQHLIFSSLLNISKISGGVYSKIFHFDAKAEVEDHIRSIGIPATFFLPAVYMTNFVPSKSFKPSPEPPHAFTLALPIPTNKLVMPLLWAEEDTGKFVKGILKNREKLLGKRIFGASAYYSMEEMVEGFQEVKPVAGKGAKAVQLPVDVYRGALAKGNLPPAIVEELSQNWEMLAQCGYFDGGKLDDSLAILDEAPHGWKDFVLKSKDFADLK